MVLGRPLRHLAGSFALLLSLAMLFVPLARAAETTGTITEISGETIHVQLPAPAQIKAGDAASIGFVVEGVGAIPLRGTWRVESVDGTNVILRPAGPGNDQPRVGQIATFRTADLPLSGASPAPQPGGSGTVGGGTGAIGEGSGWIPSGEPETAAEPEVSGAELRFVQQRLRELGYDPGPADGVMGPRTRTAISAYQRDMGMRVDGRATPIVHLSLGGMDALEALSDENLFQSDEQALQQGNDYYFGENGKPKDPARACALYETASSHGHPVGQYRLGVCYAFGNGRPQNYVTARQLFEASAAQGFPQAVFNLAVLYDKALGVARDPDRAFAYMRQAADLGLVDAYGGLGQFYLNGVGTPPSREDAIYWHQLGARAGLATSQQALQEMGVPW